MRLPIHLAAAGLGCSEHTPITVITAASGGTEADVSAGGAWAGWIITVLVLVELRPDWSVAT